MASNKIFFLMLMIVLFSYNQQIFGQTDSTIAQHKKNEIGLNIGPIIQAMLGSPVYIQPLGVTYKRVFDKWALRVNLSYKQSLNIPNETINEKTKVNDSTIIWNNNNRKTRSLTGRIGAEYRYRFKRGWYFVSGFDLQTQQTEINRALTASYYKIDSVGNPGTAEQFYHTSFIEQKKLFQEKLITKQVGFGLTVGTNIPLNKHWLIYAQLRADVSVGPTRRATTDFVTSKSTNNYSTSFDFYTDGALSELSLFYRF